MLDAAETLAQFMVKGVPDPERFRSVVGGVVAQTVSRHGRVRAFGEMVALLWAKGEHSAAIQVEALWNELGKTHLFALLCAYPMNGFGRRLDEPSFRNVCSQHSRVVPADGYAKLVTTDDRHREIARLQQMAQALEAEIAHRKEVERNLEQRERDLSDFLENSIEGIHRLGPDGT